jgi:hypothetical protein
MKKIKHYWIFIGILVLFNLTLFITKWGGDKVLLYVSDLLPIFCSLIAVVYLFAAYKKFKAFDLAKFAWLLIFIGILMNFIAESTYAMLEIVFLVDVNNVFPSIADYIWVIAYLPLMVGMIMMLIGYSKSGLPLGQAKLFSIISPIVLILFSLVIYYLLLPIVIDTETETLAKIFYLYYPVGDLFIVIPAIILIYITSLFGKGTISIPWKYMAFGFICFTVADLLYSYLSWNDNYGIGNPIDIAWNAGYLFIGLSGLTQVELMKTIEGGAK